jgi:hypothetical protein
MTRQQRIARAILRAVLAAATQCLDGLSDGTTPGEDAFTKEFTGAVKANLRRVRVDGVRVDAYVKTRPVVAQSEEPKIGADLVVVLKVDLEECALAKGFLVQAKMVGNRRGLDAQTRKMLDLTEHSWVWTYSDSGISVVPAADALDRGRRRKKGRQPGTKELACLVRRFLRCEVGDTRIDDPTPEGLRRACSDYRSQIALGIAVAKDGDPEAARASRHSGGPDLSSGSATAPAVPAARRPAVMRGGAMPSLTGIQQHLDHIGDEASLRTLFTQVLRWGATRPQPLTISVGVPVGRDLAAQPVAQLGGLPVLRVDWPGDHLPNLTERRAVHHGLRSTYAEHLLCYVTRDHRRAAFVWARPKDKKVEIRTLPYEVRGRARTTLEQLSKLAFSLDELGLFGEPGMAKVTDKLNDAFDVESVNKDFFARYESCFRDTVKPAVSKILPRDADAHAFTQLLLNRLMFCWFLQKKGWLGDDPEYLLTLVARAHNQGKQVYHDYLAFLFFEVLANPQEVRRTRQPGDPHVSWEAPFLNGGLFERTSLDERVEAAPRLKRLQNGIFDSILSGLFARYNFTVEESTSLDLQVALEPELLGTIFERLVTGRHETGSYYTPKPVVEFMCHEALAAHLRSTVPTVAQDAVIALVYDHAAMESLAPCANDVVRALDTIKVCDPACGSGAYLVTMLHELVAVYRTIYSDALRNPQSDYELKLRIIQNNLYGVDKDEFAANIARLRLWLSLVVDNPDTDPKRVKPLPNLDYKIERGDSLTAPDPSDVAGGGLFRHQVLQSANRLARIKAQYMRSFGEEKKSLGTQIRDAEEQLEADLLDSGNVPPPDGSLDWRVAFAEVFASDSEQMKSQGGFDIVLANPPYVRDSAQFRYAADEEERQARIAEWHSYRRSLKESGLYETIYDKWDLYVPFLERAHQLLRAGGHMVYIVSDAYNSAKYAGPSHDFFVANATIVRIDFCSDIPLFDAGVKNSILHFRRARTPAAHRPIRVRRWGAGKEEFAGNQDLLPTGEQGDWRGSLFRPSGPNTIAVPADTVPLGSVCYISYGLRANADDGDAEWKGKFATSDLLSDHQDKRHPKRFIEGKDIGRWAVRRVRYLEWGTRRAPGKFARPTFAELHTAGERILASRICGERPEVMVDDTDLHCSHTAIVFVPWRQLSGVRNRSIQKTARYADEAKSARGRTGLSREELEELSRGFATKYVAAVMGSTFAAAYLGQDRRSKLDFYPDDWKDLPIPTISLKQQQPIVRLVDHILEQFSTYSHPLPPGAAARVAELEQEIDERVSALYAARQTAAEGERDARP